MSILLEINGQEYPYPETGDQEWGSDATDWAVAITNGVLQKAGGLFLLLDDVDFGANFGLLAKFFSSRSASASSAGLFRLARTDVVSWRNEADDGDLALSVNSSDELLFNGTAIGNFVAVSDTSTIDLTLTAGTLTADIVAGSITNSLINAAAAIAYSKLAALTASRALASSSGGVITVATTTAAQLDYLASATAAIADTSNTGLLSSTDWNTFSAKQPAGNYITALTGDGTASGPGSVVFTLATVNSNVGSFGSSTSIPSFTVNAKGLITAASGNAVVAPAGTLTGNTLAANVVTSSLTSVGTIGTGTWQGTVVGMTYGGTGKNLTPNAGGIVWSDGDSLEIVAPGSSGQVLTSGGTSTPTWSSPLTNPMDSAGDMIVGGSGGAANKLDAGTAGQWLVAAGAASPTWTDTVTTAKTIDGSADSVQLTVQGNGTQTNDILLVEKSDGTDLLNVTNVNGTKIRGTTTNDNAASGFVGEYVSASQSSFTNTPSSGTYGDLGSIALTAGDWDIFYSVVLLSAASSSITEFRAGIGTVTGNSATGLTFGLNAVNTGNAMPSGSNSAGPYVFVQRASLTGSTTYYAKVRATYTSGPPQYAGIIYARRVR